MATSHQMLICSQYRIYRIAAPPRATICAALQRALNERNRRHRLAAANADTHQALGHTLRGQVEFDHAGFAGAEMDTLEAAQTADGVVGAARAIHVKLHHFVALARGIVLYGDADAGAIGAAAG